jgi:hypothetical protein
MLAVRLYLCAGNFAIRTAKPALNQITHDGSAGALIEVAGWRARRPAHLHALGRAHGRVPAGRP